jgi:hypothetical protein
VPRRSIIEIDPGPQLRPQIGFIYLRRGPCGFSGLGSSTLVQPAFRSVSIDALSSLKIPLCRRFICPGRSLRLSPVVRVSSRRGIGQTHFRHGEPIRRATSHERVEPRLRAKLIPAVWMEIRTVDVPSYDGAIRYSYDHPGDGDGSGMARWLSRISPPESASIYLLYIHEAGSSCK